MKRQRGSIVFFLIVGIVLSVGTAAFLYFSGLSLRNIKPEINPATKDWKAYRYGSLIEFKYPGDEYHICTYSMDTNNSLFFFHRENYDECPGEFVLDVRSTMSMSIVHKSEIKDTFEPISISSIDVSGVNSSIKKYKFEKGVFGGPYALEEVQFSETFIPLDKDRVLRIHIDGDDDAFISQLLSTFKFYCGSIAGFPCPEGLECKMPNNGTSDAVGSCINKLKLK